MHPHLRFLALTALVTSCSFTTASNFEECKTDSDCGASGACVTHYCLPLPDGCRREAGVFDKANRVPLGALMPVTTADGGPNDRENFRLNAMRLALEQANKAGGISERMFGLFVCNTNGSDDQVAVYTNWLVTNLQSPALIVSGSSRMRAAANEPSRVDAGTFLISFNATNPGLAALHKQTGNVWRVAPDDKLQAGVLAKLVSERVDAGTKIGILFENTDYGNGLATPLADGLAAAGLDPRSISFDPPLTAEKADTAIGKLVTAAPVATVVIGFPSDVVPVIESAKTHSGLTAASGHRWYMSDSAKSPSILTATTKDELAELQGTAPAQGKGSAYRTFQGDFMSRFGASADAYSFTAHAYDSMWLTLGSAAWAGTNITGPRMRDGIANMSVAGPSVPLVAANWQTVSGSLAGGTGVNADGSSGDLQFDVASGSPSSPYEVWGVTSGTITTLRFVTP